MGGATRHGLARIPPFRETRLRGERCQGDINVFWMGHQPETMSELYSHLFEEVNANDRGARVELVSKFPLQLLQIAPKNTGSGS